jgi:hypothetical protein
MAMERKAWMRIVEQARSAKSCSAKRRKRIVEGCIGQ